MSYILEALKKSDKERRRDRVPDLQADHSLSAARRQERKLLSRFLSGAVILTVCGGVALFGWQRFSAPKMQPAVKKMASGGGGGGVAVVAPVSAPAQKAVTVQKTQLTMKAVVLPPEIIEQVSKEATAAVPQVAAEPVSPVKSKTVVPHPEKKPVEPVTPLLDELPIEISAGIPDLTFAGHVYSESAPKRLIIINNRIVREGDLIANGLSLEQIELDGVILRYEDTVFRVQLF